MASSSSWRKNNDQDAFRARRRSAATETKERSSLVATLFPQAYFFSFYRTSTITSPFYT
jgi:hypothetical protein